jgi:MFS family permease
MSAVLTRWPLERRVGPTMLSAVALYGVCMMVFGLSTSFVLSLLVLAVSGGADMVSVVVRQTLVQIETPNEMRGRVSAVNSVFIGASNQLGEFESGATAALLGPVGSVVAAGWVRCWWLRPGSGCFRRCRGATRWYSCYRPRPCRRGTVFLSRAGFFSRFTNPVTSHAGERTVGIAHGVLHKVRLR